MLFRKAGDVLKFADTIPVPQSPFKPSKRLVKLAHDETSMNIR